MFYLFINTVPDYSNLYFTLIRKCHDFVSYTVIITYFFWEGKLHCVLNELTILNLNDYDSQGTARMVVHSLTSTLGYSRTQLANTLSYFVYAGVYASPEERVGGGGCLSPNTCTRKLPKIILNIQRFGSFGHLTSPNMHFILH